MAKYVVLVEVYEVGLPDEVGVEPHQVVLREAGAYDTVGDALAVVMRMFDGIPDVVKEVASSYTGERPDGATRVAPWSERQGEIARNILQLNASGAGGNNTLVVSAGDVYVQFLSSRGATEARCEAVSNRFLPAERALSEQAIGKLRELGFHDPFRDDGDHSKEGPYQSPNFSQTVDLMGPTSATRLAQLTTRLLEEVYGCAADTVVRLALTLESWRPPALGDANEEPAVTSQ